jgi:spore cortex formation protein SpoVR/YcgB (stage V sporulation)
LLKERERIATIKRKYGLRSMEEMILESEAKLIEYDTCRAKGENLPEMEPTNEQRRKEELEARKETLEEEIYWAWCASSRNRLPIRACAPIPRWKP